MPEATETSESRAAGPVWISGFADEIDPRLDEQLRVMGELGLDYLSLRSADGKSVADFTPESFSEQIAPRLETAGVRISSLGSPIGKIPVDSEEAFDAQLAQLESLCQICELSGCSYIRMFSFFIPEGKDADAFEDVVIAKLRAFVDVAGRHGVTLLHENEKDIFGDTLARCERLFERIQSPYFKAAFDFANFVQCGEDTCVCWERLRSHVVYIHIKDAVYTSSENVVFGTGDGHCEELLRRAILDEGYSGFLTLEPHLVLFDSLGMLERADAHHVIAENKAENGAAGYKMQLDALTGMLGRMGLVRDEDGAWRSR